MLSIIEHECFANKSSVSVNYLIVLINKMYKTLLYLAYENTILMK